MVKVRFWCQVQGMGEGCCFCAWLSQEAKKAMLRDNALAS